MKWLEAAACFREGDEFRLTIQGRNFISGQIIDQPFKFPRHTTGTCKLHIQPEHPNQLLLPITGKQS
jgi:predicted acyl esterase